MKKISLRILFLMLALFLVFTINAKVPQPYNKGAYHFSPTPTNDIIKYKTNQKFSRTIYIDAENGKDLNNGLSKNKALKSIDQLMKMDLTFGDQILLKGGQTYKGCIDLNNLNKTLKENTRDNNRNKETPHIHIGSYGKQKAIIDAAGYKAGIWIANSSFIDISDLKITANGGDDETTLNQRYGIRIESNNSIVNNLVNNISLYNIDIYDIFLLNPVSDENARICNQWEMNDNAGWGWGVYGETITKGKGLYNITVKDVNVSNVSQMGIRFFGKGAVRSDNNTGKCDSIKISYCNIFQSGGPGMQFSRVDFSYMKHCRITESGNRNDNRKWGRGSGMWTINCNCFLLEHNIFEGAQGIADCCGAHMDHNNSNVVIQYCLSRYNSGGFIEILGKNTNCSYRFNVSINDGWRNFASKNEKQDPYQTFWGEVGCDGDIFTITGHTGKNYVGPYYTYIYNNTIINTDNTPFTNPFHFVIATSNEGLLIKNNIFWAAKKFTMSNSMHNWKDGAAYDRACDFKISYESNGKILKSHPDRTYSGTREMNTAELAKLDLEAENNIFKRADALDDLVDGYKNAIKVAYADPLFANVNGYNAKDFIPSANFISKGVEITPLKTDDTDYGIMGGLKMHEDFFGNPIADDENIVGAIIQNAPIK